MQDKEDELVVWDVMTRGVICVDVKDTVLAAAQVMEKNEISSVIVTEEGDAVGIITERDIITKVVTKGKDVAKVGADAIMTSPLVTVKPDASIDDAARMMRDNDIRRLIVEDKGKVVGVLSEFDIVRVEPALHLLIREHKQWHLHEAAAAGEGEVSGICEACENYSENLTSMDGRMLCEDCRPE